MNADSESITRGTRQYRLLRTFKKAGLNSERASGVLAHGLRHTFATDLANANANVYTLMKLLGSESMVRPHTDTSTAQAANPLRG